MKTFMNLIKISAVVTFKYYNRKQNYANCSRCRDEIRTKTCALCMLKSRQSSMRSYEMKFIGDIKIISISSRNIVDKEE